MMQELSSCEVDALIFLASLIVEHYEQQLLDDAAISDLLGSQVFDCHAPCYHAWRLNADCITSGLGTLESIFYIWLPRCTTDMIGVALSAQVLVLFACL